MNAASPFGKQVVARTSEITRIAALPRRVWTDEAAKDLAAMLTRELKTTRGTMSLRPVQAIALFEAMEAGGLFGPMRVGSGKSLVCALMPLVLEAKRPVLLMPASLVGKTWDERKVLQEHWCLPSNVQIISYESLSLVQSAQKLEYIQPDLIICDEAHFLKGHRAGRTRRVVRYMHAHPGTKFVAVSGTIMKSSVRDFAHLLRFALKGQAPIPSTEDEVGAWADCLDEKVNPLARRKPEALLELGSGPQELQPGGVLTQARHVFQSRLLETRGVVASAKNDEVTCSIRIEALEYRLSPIMEEHFETLRRRSETPCGKSFAEAAEMRMYARELALGFSYTWIAKEKVGEWERLVASSKQQSKKPPKPSTCDSTDLKPTQPGTKDIGTSLLNRRLQELRRTSVIAKPMQNVSKSSSNNDYEIPNALLPKSTICANTITGSRARSTPLSLKDPAACAKSAAGCLEGPKQSTSITTTLRGMSEGSCASFATEPSGNLGAGIALGLSAPLRTFLAQNRPPSEWLSARKEWCSFVREQIEQSNRYDTMLQVANACRAGLLRSETLDAWKAIESSYEPLTRPIFYETTALETCLAWLQGHVGIVWVEHRAFGEALSQLSGAPYYGPGGLDASGASIANAKGDKSVIASIAACGQGFNLQMFSENLITSCPSGSSTVEQVLGRTHRDLQLADEVLVWILFGCAEHFDAFDRALAGAQATADVLGHGQKLLLADLLLPDIDNRTGPLWG